MKEKNDFKWEKLKFFKRVKKWTVSKGVSPWILSKNRNFSYGCFVHKSCQKKWFLVILDIKQTL